VQTKEIAFFALLVQNYTPNFEFVEGLLLCEFELILEK